MYIQRLVRETKNIWMDGRAKSSNLKKGENIRLTGCCPLLLFLGVGERLIGTVGTRQNTNTSTKKKKINKKKGGGTEIYKYGPNAECVAVVVLYIY